MLAGLPAGWTGGDAAADSEDDGERSSGSSAFGSSGAAAEHGSNRSGTPESLASRRVLQSIHSKLCSSSISSYASAAGWPGERVHHRA